MYLNEHAGKRNNMYDQLEKYKSNGHFFFKAKDELDNVCNAPINGMGIYLVYALQFGKVKLVYIGSSGKIRQNGTAKIRKGGMFDRLVNGKQFGEPRKKSWKQKLIMEKIDALDIYWYETYDRKQNDIPSTVKGNIIQTFLDVNEELPKWNKEF
jgi:hypothetical protein